MRVSRERSIRVDQPQLPRHPKVNYEDQIVFQVDQDVLPAPSQSGDAHAGH
jgi:hypothetical protein